MAQQMNPSFSPHAAFAHGAIVNRLPHFHRHGPDFVLPDKQPRAVVTGTTLALRSPISLQLLEQTPAQRQDPFFGAFAMTNPQLHASPVDVFGLQVSRFGQAESSGINRHQKSPIPWLSRG